MNEKTLVTGGVGFMGSRLCKKLLNEGCEVVCLDNLFTGSKKNNESLSFNYTSELQLKAIQ